MILDHGPCITMVPRLTSVQPLEMPS